MLTSDALVFCNGSPAELGRLVGVTSQAISQCGDVFPERLAARLEKATGGKMKYDPGFYKDHDELRRQQRHAA